MKKIIERVAIIIMVIGLLVACATATYALTLRTTLNTIPANYYPMSAQVVELDYQEDNVIVESYDGNLWSFEGIEDWHIGDCVALMVYDNNTVTIYDDIIVMALYEACS